MEAATEMATEELVDDQDAFGHLLLDYLRGEQVLEIVERDDGFIGVAGSPRSYFAPFHAWPAHERAGMAWARGRVLDIGCGAGRHALYLQGHGLDVTGIDRSPRAVAVCRQRGLRDAHVLDIAEVACENGSWDTLLLMGANLGLLASAETARTLLARFDEVTSPGARIIAESRDPAANSDPVHRAYHEANRQRGLLPGQLRLRIRYKQYMTPWFEYLFVAKRELEQLLADSAWRATQYIDAETETGAFVVLIEKVGA